MNPTVTQGQNFTDTAGRTGIVQYDPSTGQKLANGQTVASPTAINQAPISTTTVSNANKVEQIPKMNNQLNQLVQGRGQVTDGEITRNADGSVVPQYQDPVIPQGSSPIYGTVNGQANKIIGYNTPNPMSGINTPTYLDSNGPTPALSPEEQQFNSILDTMKASTDAQTARTIASIQNKFAMLKEQQKRVNEGQEAGVKNALLTGGVTGKGSSSQYAPISSEGIVAAQLNYGVQKLAELDSQEQDLILQAQQAGEEQNYKLLAQKLQQVESKRQEKAKEAADLNKKIAEQNEKQRETLLQNKRDTAIADIYSQGITNPADVLKALNAAGGAFSLKEVTDSLKTLVPEGLDDLVKTLRTNGAPQDVIQRVLSSQDINEAYKNAGNFAAGGTGIIGEYNYAVANGYTGSFSQYQNEDANRKAVVAKAGATQYGGFDSAQQKAIDGINTAVANNPAYKKYVSMQTYINNVETALSQGSGIGDIAAINQFQKVIDEGAVTRDQDVALIQGAQSLSDVLQTKVNKLKKGDQLSADQRKEILRITQEMLAAQKKAVEKDTGIAAQKKKAERYEVPLDETAIGEILNQENPAQKVVANDQEAKVQVDSILKTKPQYIPTAVQLVKSGYSNAQILEYLNQQK